MDKPLCHQCQKNVVTMKGRTKGGTPRYRSVCWSCHVGQKGRTKKNQAIKAKRSPHAFFKGPVCEKCNFVPEHPCQLDVDHIDGNRNNNDPANLMTLCANCHRLKTFINKDWIKS